MASTRMTAAQVEALNRAGRRLHGKRPKPTRETIERDWPFSGRAVSLTDLNAWLRESGFASITEAEAASIGLHPRRALHRSGRTQSIVVGLSPMDVWSYWAFADERAAENRKQR